MSDNQRKSIDKKVSLFIALQFIIIGVKNVLVASVPFFQELNRILNFALIGAVCILYIISFILLRKRSIYIGMLFLSLFVMLSIVMTYLFFPNNLIFWKQYELRFIIILFTSCYLLSKLHTLEYFKHYLYRGSYVITVATVIYAIFVNIIGHTIQGEYSTYSMSMANVGMLGIMWQLREVFKEKNHIALLFVIIGTIVLVLYGSRNQLLAIVFYCIIQFIGGAKNKVYRGFALVLMSIFLIMIFNELITLLNNFCNNLEVSSRTLSLLTTGGIDESAQARLDVYARLKELLLHNPLSCFGICGDEANVAEMSHSLYYSIWITYGLIGGTIFLLLIIHLCIKALKLSSGLNHQVLVLYISMVFPRSFTGGDIWGNDVFWVLLGICFLILRNKKTIISENNRCIDYGK